MRPIVYMLCGLPLSGKTVYSKKIQKQADAIRLSLDEEYFKKVGNLQQEHRDFEIEKDIEEKLKLRMTSLLKNNKSVILDFGFWTKQNRDKYKKIVKNAGGIWKLIYLKIPKKDLLQRLEERDKMKSEDFQYMTPVMLEDFYKRFEEPSNEGEEIIVPLK